MIQVFSQAKENGIIQGLHIKFTEEPMEEDVYDIVEKSSIDDKGKEIVLRKIHEIKNFDFKIYVIGGLSSGKSTLINALLRKKLIPVKNEACTATITEILDNDKKEYSAVVYEQESEESLKTIEKLTYEIMKELNDDESVYKIKVQGDIPFLEARGMQLQLVDTPGPNNTSNQEYKNTIYREINNDSNSLILYVLNGIQLSTNDDATLLGYISEQMKKGGKKVRERFLFVINKMDQFEPEEENIENVIQEVRNYLAQYEINDPQIFPCSVYAALNIRMYLEEIEIDNMSRSEERKLPSAARSTLSVIDKFNDFESMHLEQYSTLSPNAKAKLEYKLKVAEQNGQMKEQALIHCGIESIERFIVDYVGEYEKTKRKMRSELAEVLKKIR